MRDMSETRRPFAPILLVLWLCLSPALGIAEENGVEAPRGVEASGGESPGSTVEEGSEPKVPPSGGREMPEADEELRSTALLFFQALIAGVPEAIVELASYPFHLDGTIVPSRAELARRLGEVFRATDMSRIPFYGMRAYPAERMIEIFGEPPRRLEAIDLEGAWVAVANLGGHGHVAVFKHQAGAWRAVAYSE